MPAELDAKCPNCDAGLLIQEVDAGQGVYAFCYRCRSATYIDGKEPVESAHPSEVDRALARVRRVKQRFPQR